MQYFIQIYTLKCSLPCKFERLYMQYIRYTFLANIANPFESEGENERILFITL